MALTKVGDISSRDGSSESGYRVEKTTSIGPLNGKAIIDTPYSMAVTSSSLLENTMASTPSDIFRISPAIQNGGYLRGIIDPRALTDGMPTYSMSSASIEDLEKVEILTGASGFLYGVGNVGGRINYSYKRPTKERLTKLTLGNYGGSQYFVHADLGGQIDDGVFGYRVNIVKQDGETFIKDEKIDKF